MHAEHTNTAIVDRADPPGPTRARLRSHWLVLARVTWLGLAAVALGVAIVVIAVRWIQLGDPSADVRSSLAQLGLSITVYAGLGIVLEVVFRLSFFGVAALIFWRKSDEVAALFAAFTLVAVGASYGDDVAVLMPRSWDVAGSFLAGIGFTCIWILLYLFPDGRFVPRWTRLVAIGFVVLQVLREISTNVPGIPLDYATLPLPLQAAMAFGLLGSCLFAQIYRYWRVSGPVERQQTKWVVFGFAVALSAATVIDFWATLFPGGAQPGSLYTLVRHTVLSIALPAIPITVGIAILRYRLWQIDPLINRTLVYGALTAGVVGLYVLVVGGLGTLLEAPGNPLLALLVTGLVAVLFQPLRDRLQRAINRLMYGERDEPYAVLSRLGQRLEATLAHDAILPTIVQTVKDTLKLPYAAIAFEQSAGFAIAAAAGAPANDPLRLPLVYQGETIGQLLVGPRSPGEDFSPADRRLLDDLARQAGPAVHAVQLTADLQRLTTDLRRLTADLQRSREGLVLAREEERRRLRRDLHDDLAPTLAGLAFTARTAQSRLASDPAAAAALLTELHDGIRTAVGDLRRLAYDLRPPALDEFGLVAAVRERAAQYTSQAGNGAGAGLYISVAAPEQLPPLPAAVEVAAYRIFQEAVMNVMRHAQAHTCRILIALADGLELEVTDDGIGVPDDYQPGVGLRSMRERTAELGGTCAIERNLPTGTRIMVWLPVCKEEHDGATAAADR